MCRMKGACSSLSSINEKNCLNTKDDASIPRIAIKPTVTTKPSAVFTRVLLLNPAKAKSLAKKSNSLTNTPIVIINGINKIKPWIKYFKNLFIFSYVFLNGSEEYVPEQLIIRTDASFVHMTV